MFLRAHAPAELMKSPIQPEELVNKVNRKHILVSYDPATLLICLVELLLLSSRLVARTHSLSPRYLNLSRAYD